MSLMKGELVNIILINRVGVVKKTISIMKIIETENFHVKQLTVTGGWK